MTALIHQLPAPQHSRAVRDLPTRLLAAMTGADPRTAERWRAGTHPQPRYLRRLDEIDAILDILGRGMTARAKKQWLEAPNAALRWDRPAEALADGEFRRVIAAAESYLVGDAV